MRPYFKVYKLYQIYFISSIFYILCKNEKSRSSVGLPEKSFFMIFNFLLFQLNSVGTLFSL